MTRGAACDVIYLRDSVPILRQTRCTVPSRCFPYYEAIPRPLEGNRLCMYSVPQFNPDQLPRSLLRTVQCGGGCLRLKECTVPNPVTIKLAISDHFQYVSGTQVIARPWKPQNNTFITTRIWLRSFFGRGLTTTTRSQRTTHTESQVQHSAPSIKVMTCRA